MKIQQPFFIFTEGVEKAAEVKSFLKGLTVGQVMDAQIVEAVGNGRALVRIGGRVLLARCAFDFDAGALLRVRVAATGPEVLLRVVAEEPGAAAALRAGILKVLGFVREEGAADIVRNAAREWAALKGADELHASLTRLSLGPGSWDLKSYLAASGLLLEAKLAKLAAGKARADSPWPDLKAMLLKVILALDDAGLPSGSTRELLGLIEGCQSLAAASRGNEPQLFLPLVLWGFNSRGRADLAIRREERGSRGGEVWSVSLRLELESLGRILVYMVLKGSGLTCVIKAREESTRSLFQEELQSLHGRLEAAGIKSVNLRSGSLGQGEEWNDIPLRVPEGLLNMRA